MPNSATYLPISSEQHSRGLFSDLNKDFGSDGSDILFDSVAISQSLHNLFSTTVGEAGPIFNPEFGSLLPQLLQEPMDSVTEFKLRGATIQAVQRWEPRIHIDTSNTAVFVDVQNLAYHVRLAYTIHKTGERAAANLTISLLPEDTVISPFAHFDFSISYHLISWPGIYEYCILRGSSLRYGAAPHWDSVDYWSDLLFWGNDPINGLPFIRFTAVVDRGTTAIRKISSDFHGTSAGQAVLVEIATSTDGNAYSSFAALTDVPVLARFYKVRVTAVSSSPELSFGNLLFFI